MKQCFDLELPDDCPPSSAQEKQCQVFRIVKDITPSKDDLLTHQELNLLPRANACKRASVSVFDSQDNAVHRLDLSPNLGNYIAYSTLTPEHGKLSETNSKSGHIDWWPYKGMRRPDDFTVIKP